MYCQQLFLGFYRFLQTFREFQNPSWFPYISGQEPFLPFPLQNPSNTKAGQIPAAKNLSLLPEYIWIHFETNRFPYVRASGFTPEDSGALFLRESRTCGFSAVARSASLNIHMVSHALVVAVVDTFHCFTVNADGLAGMRQRTGVGVHPAMLLGKTLTAGVITTAGM